MRGSRTASRASTARSARRRSSPASSSTPIRCAPRCCCRCRSPDAFDADEVAARFGADVATLVAGVARMGGIRAAPTRRARRSAPAQAENLRKMLLAMVEDIRVVLIKLAERTQALRSLMTGDARLARARRAREVLDLFAPLANRLGVWQLKWELEDLSLRALEPATYKSIAKLLDERRLDRERYIEDVVDDAAQRARRARASPRRSRGRPKHIYSIWSKMQRKQAGIDALYDIRAVRILVDSVKDCYTALGLVHHLLDAARARVRRLHREAEGQQLPVAAHRGRSARRASRSKCRSARARCTSIPSTASPRTGATRKAARKGARQRPDVRREDRVAAAGARLEGRGRRFERVAARRSRKASSPTRSTC